MSQNFHLEYYKTILLYPLENSHSDIIVWIQDADNLKYIYNHRAFLERIL